MQFINYIHHKHETRWWIFLLLLSKFYKLVEQKISFYSYSLIGPRPLAFPPPSTSATWHAKFTKMSITVWQSINHCRFTFGFSRYDTFSKREPFIRDTTYQWYEFSYTAMMASGTSAQQQNVSEAPEEDAAELQFPKGKNILLDVWWIII